MQWPECAAAAGYSSGFGRLSAHVGQDGPYSDSRHSDEVAANTGDPELPQCFPFNESVGATPQLG